MSLKQTEIKVKVPTEDLEKLDEIARRTGVSTADIVRQAISLEVILANAKQRDAKIIIEEKDYSLQEMIF